MLPEAIPEVIDPQLFLRVSELLDEVERMPHDATGVLRFSPNSMVLIESRSICWSCAPGLKHRLTDLLRTQRNPPIERAYLESVFRDCRASGTPFGEAVLATGLITEDGLRLALLRQTSEAIARIANEEIYESEFVRHTRSRYDARFSFSPWEVMASIGASTNPAQAAAASTHLNECLVPDTRGFAFEYESAMAAPIVLAVSAGSSLRVGHVLDLGRWTAELFDITVVFDSDISIAAATWRGASVVSWRLGATHYVALCSNRAAAARMVARLSENLETRQDAR